MPIKDVEHLIADVRFVEAHRGDPDNHRAHVYVSFHKADLKNFSAENELHSLQISCSLKPGEEKPFGFSYYFKDVFSVDMYDAEHMLKVLRFIDRGMAAQKKKLGECESFGAWLVRVLHILGIQAAELKSYRYGDKLTIFNDEFGDLANNINHRLIMKATDWDQPLGQWQQDR